jgi:hypothetical protein
LIGEDGVVPHPDEALAEFEPIYQFCSPPKAA